MEENAEEIINEAVEIAGVNGAIDQGIEQELQNLDQLLNQNPAMHNIQVHIPIQNQDIDNSEGAGAEAAPTGGERDRCGSSSTSPPTERSSSSHELPWLMVERVDIVPCELAFPKGLGGARPPPLR